MLITNQENLMDSRKIVEKRLFANFKKYQFCKNKVCFLGYIVLAPRVQRKDKRINVVKKELGSKFVKEIRVFLGFANFYCCFIQGFSKITGPLS